MPGSLRHPPPAAEGAVAANERSTGETTDDACVLPPSGSLPRARHGSPKSQALGREGTHVGHAVSAARLALAPTSKATRSRSRR